MRHRPAVRAAVWLTAALALGGCATERSGTADPIEQHQILNELDAGRLRLGCELACAGSWRAARPALRGLHTQQVWPELVVEVARIGHANDLAYYYLGRAAEARGRSSAAALYYRLALASTRSCDGFIFNSCDGVQFPGDAEAALARVSTP